MREGPSFSVTAVVCLFLSAIGAGFPVRASSSKLKDVCASGCTYSDLQTAIDSISDSSATNVYTIYVDAGVISTDDTITLDGKSYINVIGRGMGASIVRATATWYENHDPDGDLLDVSGSTHVTLRGLTLDMLTNDPGDLDLTGRGLGALRTDNAGAIEIDSCEILGMTFGIVESDNDPGNLLVVRNSRVVGVYSGFWSQGAEADWEIFGSDVVALGDAGASHFLSANGIIWGNSDGELLVWGSQVYAEIEAVDGGDSPILDVIGILMYGGNVSLIGSTVKAELGTTSVAEGLEVLAIQSRDNTLLSAAGSHLQYETPASVSGGKIGGIHYTGHVTTSGRIDVAGTDVADLGGTGGDYRADVLWEPTGLGAEPPQPSLRFAGSRNASFLEIGTKTLKSDVASSFQTLNFQSGTAQFASASTVSVTLPISLPAVASPNYRVAVTSDANEKIWVTSKTSTGFTIHSQNNSSTAHVDWIVMR